MSDGEKVTIRPEDVGTVVVPVRSAEVTEEEAAELFKRLPSMTLVELLDMGPAKAQSLLERTDVEAAELEAAISDFQRALKDHRVEIKAKVRPLIARQDAIGKVRLILAIVAPSQKIG